MSALKHGKLADVQGGFHRVSILRERKSVREWPGWIRRTRVGECARRVTEVFRDELLHGFIQPGDIVSICMVEKLWAKCVYPRQEYEVTRNGAGWVFTPIA